jgi:hypothetical protein
MTEADPNTNSRPCYRVSAGGRGIEVRGGNGVFVVHVTPKEAEWIRLVGEVNEASKRFDVQFEKDARDGLKMQRPQPSGWRYADHAYTKRVGPPRAKLEVLPTGSGFVALRDGVQLCLAEGFVTFPSPSQARVMADWHATDGGPGIVTPSDGFHWADAECDLEANKAAANLNAITVLLGDNSSPRR